MGARKITIDREVQLGQPILCAVGEGSGVDHAGIHVGVDLAPPIVSGKLVTVTVVQPTGSLMAFLTLAEVASLQDELDRAVAELTGFVQAGGAA